MSLTKRIFRVYTEHNDISIAFESFPLRIFGSMEGDRGRAGNSTAFTF